MDKRNELETNQLREFEAIKVALQGSPFRLNLRSRKGNSWSITTLGWKYRLSWTLELGWVLTPSNSSKSYQELKSLIESAVKGAT